LIARLEYCPRVCTCRARARAQRGTRVLRRVRDEANRTRMPRDGSIVCASAESESLHIANPAAVTVHSPVFGLISGWDKEATPHIGIIAADERRRDLLRLIQQVCESLESLKFCTSPQNRRALATPLNSSSSLLSPQRVFLPAHFAHKFFASCPPDYRKTCSKKSRWRWEAQP